MHRLLVALVVVAAGCASAPPAAPPSAPAPPDAPASPSDLEPITEPEEELVTEPEEEDDPCAPGSFENPFSFQLTGFVEKASPLLGCPASALADEGWGLGEPIERREDGEHTYVAFLAPRDSSITLGIDLHDGRVVRLTRDLRTDAQRVVSFFRLETATAPGTLGAEPVLSRDDRQVYEPTDGRPFWIDAYRTPEAIVATLVDPGAEALVPSLDDTAPGAESDGLAAGGSACDAPFERGADPFYFADLDVLTARLGCPYEDALADLGLSDPIEVLDAPQGGVVESFTGLSSILPGLTVSAQRLQGRLAALAVTWPGEQALPALFRAKKTQVQIDLGMAPDLDEVTQAMWFDDDDLRYGVVVQLLAGGFSLQLIDSRWF